MPNKLKRKITVSLNTRKSKSQTKTRPSVFDRLGIKSVAGSTTLKEYCHPWAQSGTCPYGKGCKYSKTHTLISPSKQRAAKIQTEPKKRHAKEGHKRVHPGKPENWDQWGPDELEDADPDDLERKRQELQRELELQMKMEHKARKKEKKSKKESSPSSDSSSSSSDSTSSSDESSSTSTSSLDAKRKKLKKLKSKRTSSSSSEGRGHRHKKIKQVSKSTSRDKSKKAKPHGTKIIVKSPSPVRIRKKSATPPIKPKLILKKDIAETKSPRPLSRSSDRKDKHRTPSPKSLRDKEREKEREREKEKEREREREKEKEREREREREKEREKERERERERERAKQREKEREREKKKDSRSPKRDSRPIKEIKRRESPDSSHSRDRKFSPSRPKPSSASKRDRSLDRRDKRDERARSRGKDRVIDKSRKDKRDSRDRERDRDRERERRLREEREAAREKEREEALARCQERQRERERLKELEKKEIERRGRDRVRRDDRGLDKPSGDRVERLLPLPEDRIPPGRRHSPERDRGDRRDGRGHSVDTRKSARNSPDRHDRMDREIHERGYDRERGFDREHDERSREYGMTGRVREDRGLDDKTYDSPYDRTRHDDRRYMEMEDHYNEGSREDRVPLDGRDFVDDRRDPRRDMWEMRDERVDMERDFTPRGRGYGRPDVRPPGPKGRGDWVEPDFPEHEWDNRGRRPIDWENREGWDGMDRPHAPEDEWRHYDRGVDNWPPNDNRRRWPNNRNNDWRDNRDINSRPKSAASHVVEPTVTEDPSNESSRKEKPATGAPQRSDPIASTEPVVDPKPTPVQPTEPEQDSTSTGKRPAEDAPDGSIDAKKVCSKPEPAPVLEDDLSEISDDADDILNRDEDILEEPAGGLLQSAAAESEGLPSTSEQVPSATASQKSQSPLRSPAKSAQKDDSIDGDNVDLDFEEISEDELDEDSKVKGIGDALGVDWASLVAESRSRVKPMSSAKLRWEPHNILVNLGVSVRLAGDELVKDVLREHAEAELKQEVEEKTQAKIKPESSVAVNINGIKQEIKEEPDDVFKEEPKEESKIDPDDLNISHPIAAIQVANQETQQIRRTLFTSVGPHRRALSARRDLMIRRHLCNLPINDSYVEAPKRHDPELFKAATQLFERCL